MKTADKAVETVVETTEAAIEVVAHKTTLLTPKNLIITAGVTLVIVGVVYGVKKFRARAEENEEE